MAGSDFAFWKQLNVTQNQELWEKINKTENIPLAAKSNTN